MDIAHEWDGKGVHLERGCTVIYCCTGAQIAVHYRVDRWKESIRLARNNEGGSVNSHPAKVAFAGCDVPLARKTICSSHESRRDFKDQTTKLTRLFVNHMCASDLISCFGPESVGGISRCSDASVNVSIVFSPRYCVHDQYAYVHRKREGLTRQQ